MLLPATGATRVTFAVLEPLVPPAAVTVRGITKEDDVALALSVPTVQVIFDPAAVQPPGKVPIEKSPGIESVTVTPVACWVPLLVADKVSVAASPVSNVVKPVATDTSAELACKSVPAVTVTTRRTGPLFD